MVAHSMPKMAKALKDEVNAPRHFAGEVSETYTGAAYSLNKRLNLMRLDRLKLYFIVHLRTETSYH